MTEPDMLPGALRRLAGLLAPVLGGPAPAAVEVDGNLVRLAIHRHQVGPLLHAALLSRPETATEDLMRDLQGARWRSTDRHALDLARLRRIGEMFTEDGVSWMALKGTPQAARLYGDPGLRPSSDIDLLVTPRDFVRAVTLLADRGYVPSNPPAPPGPLRAPVLAAVRDVSLIASDDRTCAVDLHRRLFLAVGGRAQRLQLTPEVGPLPMPRMDADLACYLIMHGAQSYWVRLKWLVDIVVLLSILDDREKLAIMTRAQQVGVEKSVAASLLLLRLLFPFAQLGPLEPWITGEQQQSAVRKRLARYAEMIGADSNWKRSPLDNARVGMEAYWALFEAPWTRARMIPVALLSSAVRRLAGAVWRADRALTRDDRSPDQIAAAQRLR
jgi:hypothetical protein